MLVMVLDIVIAFSILDAHVAKLGRKLVCIYEL
jgi:hypothetical protein